MTDLELAAKIAAADPEALETLVREHHAPVFRFLRQLTRRTEDAEDLAQQTLVRVTQRADRFDGRASLRTWIHRIAYREYLNWRRRQRWNVSLLLAPPQLDAQHGAVLDAEWLRALLSRLPEPQRVAFVLANVQELSLEEIAAITRVPVGTVKSRLFHARKQLQELLAESEKEYPYATECV